MNCSRINLQICLLLCSSFQGPPGPPGAIGPSGPAGKDVSFQGLNDGKAKFKYSK